MRKKYVIGLIAGIAALSVGFMVGYYVMRSPSYGRTSPQSTPLLPVKAENDNEPIDSERYSSDQTVTLAQDAVLQLVTVYMSCGHEVVDETPVPSDLIGLNEMQVAEKYTEWRIDEFMTDKVVLVREASGYCPDHFIIKENNGVVVVYDTTGKLLRNTGVPIDILPTMVQEQVKEGLIVNSLEEVNTILENLDS